MIWRAILYLVKSETRYHYPRMYRFLMHAISALLTLVVYWLTSKSLSGFLDQSQAWKAESYFEFLLIGEMVMSLPVILVNAVMRAIRFSSNEGLLEDLSLHPRGIFAPISMIAFSYLTREAVHVALIVVLSYLFFGFSLSITKLALIFILIVFSSPIFYALGLISGAIFLRTGRGEGLVGQALNLATIFAGTYFPLTILPGNVVSILERASPFTVVLQTARDVSAGLSVDWLSTLGTLLAWNVLLLLIAWVFIRGAALAIYRRGLPPLSHP